MSDEEIGVMDSIGAILSDTLDREKVLDRKKAIALKRNCPMSPNQDSYGKLFHDHAAQSHALEVGCQQFDVCQDQQNSNTIFCVYEIYDDEAAFGHCHVAAAPHYDEFNLAIDGMVVKKSICRRFCMNFGHHS